MLHGIDIRVVSHEPATVFDLIDTKQANKDAPAIDLQRLWNDSTMNVSFDVRYQLEVCISHGILSEYTMGREFVEKLQALDPKHAKALLEHVASFKNVVLNPMSIFDLRGVSGANATEIPPYCALVRSVMVTPTTMYINTPQVETSNRVLRQYSAYKDRFLRVRIADEKSEVRACH